MRTYGASVIPSAPPMDHRGRPRRSWRSIPDTTGSLGCAISEAVEKPPSSREGYRYVLGSVLNQVLLHQSIIGLEAKTALDKYGVSARMSSSAAPAAAPTWAA